MILFLRHLPNCAIYLQKSRHQTTAPTSRPMNSVVRIKSFLPTCTQDIYRTSRSQLCINLTILHYSSTSDLTVVVKDVYEFLCVSLVGLFVQKYAFYLPSPFKYMHFESTHAIYSTKYTSSGAFVRCMRGNTIKTAVRFFYCWSFSPYAFTLSQINNAETLWISHRLRRLRSSLEAYFPRNF